MTVKRFSIKQDEVFQYFEAPDKQAIDIFFEYNCLLRGGKMVKKHCQCGKVHTTPAAITRCFRQRKPDYGLSKTKKIQKVEVPLQTPTVALRNRQIQKVSVSQLDLDKGRKNYTTDGQERVYKYKNVLWANALNIQQRIQSSMDKKTKTQALKILLKTQQSLWYTISLYIQKRSAVLQSPQIPQTDQKLWEEYYLNRTEVIRVLEQRQTRKLLRDYYQHCVENDFLLGEPQSFAPQFAQIGQIVLPMTQTRYKTLLRDQYQFYFALEGSQQHQMKAVMSYLKKRGLQKLLTLEPYFRSSMQMARKVITRLATTAFYYFNGASNMRQIVLFRQVFDWMLQLISAYQYKREWLYQYQRAKLRIIKEKQKEQYKQDDVIILVSPPILKIKKASTIKPSRSWLHSAQYFYQTKEQRFLRFQAEQAKALQQKQRLLEIRRQKRRIRGFTPPNAMKEVTHKKNPPIPHNLSGVTLDGTMIPVKSRFNLKRFGLKKIK